MIKNILNLEKVRILKKEQQKSINGGFFGCQPQIIQCYSDRDCLPCSSRCGFTIDINGEPTFISGVCAF